MDYHSFFFTHSTDSFIQLGEALHFHGIALRYAPTPQAKGKIERPHDYWQKRLPPLLAAEHILALEPANALLDQILTHANEHEIHRELGSTPNAAHRQALAQNRSRLRPPPACPWWRFVWRLRSRVRVGDDGKVPVRTLPLSVDSPPRSHLTRCMLPDGDLFFLKSPPSKSSLPIVLLDSPIF